KWDMARHRYYLPPPFLLPSGQCHGYSTALTCPIVYCVGYSRVIVLSSSSRATNARPPLPARRMNPQAMWNLEPLAPAELWAGSIGSEPNPGAGRLGRLQVPCCWMQAQNPAPDSACMG